MRTKLNITVIFLVLLGAITLPAHAQEERMAGSKSQSASSKNNQDTYKQLHLFGDVFERVRAQYVEPIEDSEMIESAINGMLSNLDPHSSYLDEDDFKDMQIRTKGEFGGLGIEVTMDNGLVKVVSPIDDTPAFRAGVMAGDLVTHLDDEPIMGMTLSEAVDKMRGKVGTSIELTIRREGEKELLKIKIIRDTIKIRPVRHRVEGNVGYIRITTFMNEHADKDVIKAIKDIKEELGDNLTGFVIDLRNNPGGLLDQAVAISDIFLDKGEIVSTRGRHERDTKRDNASKGDMAEGLPIVVLINGGSASASEIVAGALQDHRRAIILGTTSFGKGSVQTVIPLPGHGAMRLTTARYYTPSGRSIQAKGIEPDIMVEQAHVESLNYRALRESDLHGALDNDKNEKKEPIDHKNKKEDLPKDKTSDKETDDKTEDYQLARALDLLRGVSLYNKRFEVDGFK